MAKAIYKLKPGYQTGNMSFNKHIPGIGFTLDLTKVTQAQMEILYALGHSFVIKEDVKEPTK